MATRSDIDQSIETRRFLDVTEELLEILPPIEKLEDTPTFSLDQAIVSLEAVVPDIKLMLETIQSIHSKPEDALSRDESNSIWLYTLEWEPSQISVSNLLNETLRCEDRRKLEPWLPFLRLFLTAFSHLPSANFTIYRGANMDLSAKYRVGEKITWWGFSSCINKTNHMERKLNLNKSGKRTLFSIDSFSARDIRRFSMQENNEQVLLPPGSQFLVINSFDKGRGFHMIELKEIQSEYDIMAQLRLPTNTTFDDTPFEPISVVSLSKKRLPAALPNLRLEERLSEYYAQNPKVDLKSMQLFDSDMDVVASEFIVNKQCFELNLCGNRITPHGISILAHALRGNKTLTILNLAWNEIGDAGTKLFAKVLRNNMTLSTLDISRNEIGNMGIEPLAEALKVNTALTTLDLSRNEIENTGISSLVKALERNTTLTTLNLSWNHIGPSGGKSISELLLTNMTLVTLDLSWNCLEPEGAKILAEALRTNTTLTTLNLSWNGIKAAGAKSIAESLLINKALTTLDLSWNYIESVGAKTLAEALRTNTALTAFNLSWNGIGAIGARSLSEALRINTTLSVLDISRNGIGDIGADSLEKALRTNNTLTMLDVSYNEIGITGAKSFSEALQRNATIKWLKLGGNRMGMIGEELLASACDRVEL
ncbi:unnamed protein product [Adineta ricciae]|uniref:NAD(P)(+)--arginine ADP-ribosyltransferase n=1 Tax=Adineta ricciae TaxID=249248 RepID=A0A815LIC4_ADIRI|nr:unnamed protein product [Adineta ricciae]